MEKLLLFCRQVGTERVIIVGGKNFDRKAGEDNG
jgi:hypothetical protein